MRRSGSGPYLEQSSSSRSRRTNMLHQSASGLPLQNAQWNTMSGNGMASSLEKTTSKSIPITTPPRSSRQGSDIPGTNVSSTIPNTYESCLASNPSHELKRRLVPSKFSLEEFTMDLTGENQLADTPLSIVSLNSGSSSSQDHSSFASSSSSQLLSGRRSFRRADSPQNLEAATTIEQKRSSQRFSPPVNVRIRIWRIFLLGRREQQIFPVTPLFRDQKEIPTGSPSSFDSGLPTTPRTVQRRSNPLSTQSEHISPSKSFSDGLVSATLSRGRNSTANGSTPNMSRRGRRERTASGSRLRSASPKNILNIASTHGSRSRKRFTGGNASTTNPVQVFHLFANADKVLNNGTEDWETEGTLSASSVSNESLSAIRSDSLSRSRRIEGTGQIMVIEHDVGLYMSPCRNAIREDLNKAPSGSM